MATIPFKGGVGTPSISDEFGAQVDIDGNVVFSDTLTVGGVQSFLSGAPDLADELKNTLTEPITNIGFS